MVSLQAGLIMAACFWVYFPALHGGWIWDDVRYIPQNPLLHDPARLWKTWFQPQLFMEYYPVESTVQFAEWKLWGNDTLGYHLVNVILHGLSALLVWRLLLNVGVRLAWIGGLLFAVHPIMVESVAWAVELKNTLALPLLLLAMCTYCTYDEGRQRGDYALAIGAFLVSMLCKTSGVMFPLVILLYVWWKRRRIGIDDLKASAPFFLISLLLSLLALWLQFGHPSPSTLPASGLVRIDTVGWQFMDYLIRFAWPVNLLPLYPSGVIAKPGWVDLFPWLLVGGVFCLAWRDRQGWGRSVLLGGGFFVLNWLPVFAFILMSATFMIWSMDHLIYLPVIGLIGLAAAGAGQLQERLPSSWRPLGMAIIAVILVALAWESRVYAGAFTDTESFWTRVLKGFPESQLASQDLGIYFMQTGRIGQAEEIFRRALRFDPNSASGYYDLGSALAAEGRGDEATTNFKRALALQPAFPEVYRNLGLLMIRAGRWPEAAASLQRAAQLDPNNQEIRNELDQVDQLLKGERQNDSRRGMPQKDVHAK